MKISSRLTLRLLLALVLLGAPGSITYGAPAQAGDPCLCVVNIGAECTDDLSSVGHYNPQLPDPAPAEPAGTVAAPSTADVAISLWSLLSQGEQSRIDRLSLTTSISATENDLDWALAVHQTSQAVSQEQAQAVRRCEQSFSLVSDEPTEVTPTFSTRLRGVFDDAVLSIAAFFNG